MQLTALVVDDSGVMRKMVMKSLKEADLAEFEFIEAEDGQKALEKMSANDIDIGFVDWNMPNMTGVEFIKHVRRMEEDNGEESRPLIMITSEKTMSKVQEALDEAGADGFISKPFTVDELQRKLCKLVETAESVGIQRRQAKRQEEAGEEEPKSGGWFGKVFG
jgi:two-component system, chemotaxis family, chemotaxis protein CheY